MSMGPRGSFLEQCRGLPVPSPDALVDPASRRAKAAKIVAVLAEFSPRPLSSLRCLDVGCSAGLIAGYLAEHFGQVVGVDPDEKALALARQNLCQPNLSFYRGQVEDLPLPPKSFDAIVCNHVYEHAPDQKGLMDSVHKLLKDSGFCYFAAGNRLVVVEGHYGLPFLSWLPQPMAHLYLRAAGRGQYYAEKHLTYWGLRRLLRQFTIHDYTLEIIRAPHKYAAEDLIKSGSLVARLPEGLLRALYFLLPTYVWVLTKRPAGGA